MEKIPYGLLLAAKADLEIPPGVELPRSGPDGLHLNGYVPAGRIDCGNIVIRDIAAEGSTLEASSGEFCGDEVLANLLRQLNVSS